jgi:hypothetical protein
MTITEAGKMYDLSHDTLRYYKRIGLIPAVEPRGIKSIAIKKICNYSGICDLYVFSSAWGPAGSLTKGLCPIRFMGKLNGRNKEFRLPQKFINPPQKEGFEEIYDNFFYNI